MENEKISFLSSKNRGFSIDLRIIKDYLMQKDNTLTFCYFLQNENSKNRWVRQGVKSAKKEYCRKIGTTICIDGSLPNRLAKTAKEGEKIFVSVPYDYQFKAACKEIKGKKSFKSFTTIIAGSPFGKRLLKKNYGVPESKIIDNVCAPLAWQINQKEKQQEIRKSFESYFPKSKGKKILSILVVGGTTKKKALKVDWENYLETLGDEWFVFVNNEELLNDAVRLNSHYASSFGYVNKMLDARELLYFSDCIITNSGMYASYFASKRKPVYCLNYGKNYFEKYMKRNYNSMYLRNLSEKVHEIKEENFTDTQKSFCDNFSYGTEINPSDKIFEIINNGEKGRI